MPEWERTEKRLISILHAIDSPKVGELAPEHFTPNNMFFTEEAILSHYKDFLGGSAARADAEETKSLSTTVEEEDEEAGQQLRREKSLESHSEPQDEPREATQSKEQLLATEDKPSMKLSQEHPLSEPLR